MAIFIPLVTKFDPKGLQGAQRALANFQNFAVEVGRVAAAAIAAVAVTSVKQAAQFETTFAKIQGLVGLTTDEIDELQKAARKLGPEFGKSSNEAADALFFITSSGLRGADAINVLEASLKGAAIGLGDVNALANAATAAMNTYGPAVLSGTDAVDALAEAVRLGQFAPEELAGSLGRVIPIAAELGVSFQETTGLIAGLTRGGLNASEAVTGVRGAMQAFIKPTQEAKKIMEEYGLTSEEVADSIEQDGFLDTLIKLREAFGENEEDFTRVIGSIEGLSAVLSLTGANVETNTEIIADMTDEVGILDEAMATVADTAEFKFDKAMETAKDSLIEIGGALLDDLQPHLDTFQSWIEDNGPEIEQGFIDIFDAIDSFVTSEALGKLTQHFKDMWPEIESTVSQLGSMAVSLSPLLVMALEEVLPGLGDLASIIDDISFFLDELLSGFGAWEKDTPYIVKFIQQILNPMSALLFVVEGLAAALNAARRAYEDFAGISRAAETISYRGFGADVIGRRAGGGPVASGSSYLVGEMGPEIFTPASGGGSITPNSGMGGAVYNITVNAGMGAGDGARLGEQIVSAIRRYERSSGPVFASA